MVARIRSVLTSLDDPLALEKADYEGAIAELRKVHQELTVVEAELVTDIEERHGTGRADSVRWRQFMAEYVASLPAAHLDSVRVLIKVLEASMDWLRSPECTLAFRHCIVLCGDPGTGKTHGVCDTARRRHEDELRTCIVFGHEFANQQNPWISVANSLDVPTSLGVDGLLDCLNAAGLASGNPLLLCVDAINETKPLTYWKDYIATMVHKVSSRPNLRLCLVCKTAYMSRCLPDNHNLAVVKHLGFIGIERQACQSYFRHFHLQPPIAPILQPELSNPLYLGLVCETLTAEGKDRLPAGWSGGGTAIIREFLRQKSNQFSNHFENTSTSVSTRCLMNIVREIATGISSFVPWRKARELIASEVSDPDAVLTWLVNEALLIEDVNTDNAWEQASVLRPAFERLGDFLIATEILNLIPDGAFDVDNLPDEQLDPWLKSRNTIRTNRGVLAEFAVLAAERFPGFELTELAADSERYDELASIVINSLTYRDPSSLTSTTTQLVRHALSTELLYYDTTDAILSCGLATVEY